MNRVLSLPLSALLGLVLLAGAALAAAPADPAALFDNPVLAKGRGFEIRQAEMDEAVATLRGTLATQGQDLPRQDEPTLRKRMLERMVLTRILLQRATPDDKAKARELADKFIADTKKKAPSEESYRRQLIATGLKPEAFEARALDQAIVEKVIERELKSKITVPESDIREFYELGNDVNTRELSGVIARLEATGGLETVFYRDATNRFAMMRRSNLSRLDRPEQVKASLILLYTTDPATRSRLSEEAERAKYLLATNTVARLKAGADFAQVAREVSEDPDVDRTGGEYVATSKTGMAPELLAALFTLPVGEISQPIITRFGLYIARVKERIPAMKLPLPEIEKDIRDLLLTQVVEQRIPAYSEQLKKEYDVQMSEPPKTE